MAPKTIVVVDDSPTLLKLVQLVLGEMDLHVVPAATATAALVAIEEAKPALVLLDDVLDDTPIEELCKTMASKFAPAPKVVLLCSGRGPADPLKVPGVVDSIAKPFSPDALKTVVSHLVGLDTHVAPQSPRRLLRLTPPPEFVPERRMNQEDLSGSLAAFSAGDVLGMLGEGQKTGVIRFTLDRTVIGVCFGKGRVAFARAEGIADEFLLGRFLVEREYVQAKDLEATAKAAIAGAHAPRLGQRLIAKGLIKERELIEAMRMQTSALVYELLRWDRGRFSFTSDVGAQTEELDLTLSVDHLLMEGLRRVDEWRIIEREVHNFDEVFLREEDRMAAMGPGKLLREEIAVAELLNGKNTVRDVIFQSHLGSFDVCRVIYRLRKSRLVRPRVSPLAP